MGIRSAGAVVVFLGVLVAGCGTAAQPGQAQGGTSPKPQQTMPASTPTTKPAVALPSCDSIWVAGKKLPARYRGCVKDGKQVKGPRLSCESGQQLFTYAGKMYAVGGGKVIATDVRHNKMFKKIAGICTA